MKGLKMVIGEKLSSGIAEMSNWHVSKNETEKLQKKIEAVWWALLLLTLAFQEQQQKMKLSLMSSDYIKFIIHF